MLLVSLGESHCKDGAEWYFENPWVSDGSLIEVRDQPCDYCIDQGCVLGDNYVLDDYVHELDNTEARDDGEDTQKPDDDDSY